MEFEGRITRILPARTGTRNDGSPWTELSFVFAYFENSEQHYEDSTIVSTFDTPIMAALAPYVTKDEKGRLSSRMTARRCWYHTSHAVAVSL